MKNLKSLPSLMAFSILLILFSVLFAACTDVMKAPINSEKKITNFYFLKSLNPALMKDTLHGTINETDHTIMVNLTQTGLDLGQLVASFTTTNLTSIAIGYKPQESGITQNNFSTVQKYTVTAQDGSTQTYQLTVTVPNYTTCVLKNLYLKAAFNTVLDKDYSAVIDTLNKTVQINLPDGTNKSALKLSYSLSPKASVMIGSVPQISDVTPVDFTNSQTITVVAEDQIHKQNYVVSVKIANFKSYTVTSLADANAFVPGDSVRNLTLSGAGVTNQVMTVLASKIGSVKVAGLVKYDNTSVTTTKGFVDVVNCTGGFCLLNNAQLVDMTAFTGFTKIGGDFIVENCPNLSFGTTSAASNWKYTDGTINIKSIAGTLRILSKKVKQDAFKSLTTVGGNFNFENCGMDLWNFDPMLLTSIGGDVILINNDVLSNFRGLQNLASLGGNVTITGNVASVTNNGSETDVNRWRLILRLKNAGIIKPSAVLNLKYYNGGVVDLSTYIP